MYELTEKRGFTASTLKWLAIIFMVINHLCYTLYYNVGIENYFLAEAHWYITRFAFVIFAFQITEGMHYTSNKVKYILSLFIIGAIAEIPYNLMCSYTWYDPESMCVMWTLGLGATAIALIEKCNKKPLISVVITLLATFIGFKMGAEYHLTGIPMMVLFYCFRETKWKAMLYGALAFIIGSALEFILSYMAMGYDFSIIIKSTNVWKLIFEEWHGLVAWILIFFYNGQKGKNINKWFFYGFYPVHLFLFYLLALLLNAIL